MVEKICGKGEFLAWNEKVLYDHMMYCGSISSYQSAVTSEIVQHCRSRVSYRGTASCSRL